MRKHVEYSDTEKKIFNLLKGGKKLTISEIAERIYRDREKIPFYHCETIYKIVHRLGEKTRYNREPLTLYKECPKGPHEITYWME